jgi:hypothetical protein
VERAGHVRRLGGARSPVLEKETVVREIRAKLGWFRWTKSYARVRQTRWSGLRGWWKLNGDSSERQS